MTSTNGTRSTTPDTTTPRNRLPAEKQAARNGQANGAGRPAAGTADGQAPAKNGARKNGAARRSMADVYAGLVGKAVTVATTAHLEDAPVGRRLHAGTFRAKVVGLGADHLVLAAEYVHGGRSGGSEPMKQFVPFATIQRVSVLKSELILHL